MATSGFSVAFVALTAGRLVLGFPLAILRQRSADIVGFTELTVLVATHVTLVSRVGLDGFAFARHGGLLLWTRGRHSLTRVHAASTEHARSSQMGMALSRGVELEKRSLRYGRLKQIADYMTNSRAYFETASPMGNGERR